MAKKSLKSLKNGGGSCSAGSAGPVVAPVTAGSEVTAGQSSSTEPAPSLSTSSLQSSSVGGKKRGKKSKTVKTMKGCGNAYCVKCRKKCNMNNCHNTTSKNGRKMLKGNCVHCNTKMNKFLPN